MADHRSYRNTRHRSGCHHQGHCTTKKGQRQHQHLPPHQTGWDCQERQADCLQYMNSNPEPIDNKQFIEMLNNYFTKQLDFCIGKSDTKEIVKYLDILNVIQKNKL